jgi:hypothetical protein
MTWIQPQCIHHTKANCAMMDLLGRPRDATDDHELQLCRRVTFRPTAGRWSAVQPPGIVQAAHGTLWCSTCMLHTSLLLINR